MDLIQDRVAFNMLMVSLISADTLTSADARKQSLEWLDKISEVINCDGISDERKQYVKSTLEKSYTIVNTYIKPCERKNDC